MKLKSALTLAVAAGMLAASCTKNDKNCEIDFRTISGRAAYTLVGSADDFRRDSDIVYADSALLILPVQIYDRDISELRDSILSVAFDTIAEPQEAMQSFFRKSAGESGYALRELPADSVSEENAQGSTIVTGSVVSLSGDMMSYCITTSVYMPMAAHGIWGNRYFTFDIKNGRLLTLDRLFTPEGMKALPDIISRRAQLMVNSIGPTSITGLPGGDNFYISSEGSIVFAYQPYEVASYAQGEIRIPFYPYQLSDYLSEEGLSVFNLK